MIIGTFAYDTESDIYRGEIQTLGLSREAVEFKPQTRSNDREPDYRVVVTSALGDIEFGAAWQRKTDRGRAYLSVLLDDPSLDRALSAALFPDDDGKANLVWSRPVARVTEPEPEAAQRRGRVKPGLQEPAQS